MGVKYLFDVAITKNQEECYGYNNAIAEMCHPKFLWLEPEQRQEPPPTVMEQYVAYNQLQWQYYNELFHEVHSVGIYGAYYEFLLAELVDGPYWSDVKAQFGQVKEEYDPEASVSGSREPQPEDDSSEDTSSDSEDASDSDWEYLSKILAKKSEDGA